MPKLQLIEEPWWGRESRISLVSELVIHASAEDVFDVLADHRQWSKWYPGMITVELTGRTTGIGVERQVRIGRSRIVQHFTVWEPNRRLTMCHVRSTAVGLAAVVEDWELIDDHDGTLVKYVVGAEPRTAARSLTPVFRSRLRSATAGAAQALRERVELVLTEGPEGSIALLAGDATGGVAIPPTTSALPPRIAEAAPQVDEDTTDARSESFWTGGHAADSTDAEPDETPTGTVFTDEAFAPSPDDDAGAGASSDEADVEDRDTHTDTDTASADRDEAGDADPEEPVADDIEAEASDDIERDETDVDDDAEADTDAATPPARTSRGRRSSTSKPIAL